MKEIADAAEAENRDLSAEEQANWDRADADIRALDARIERQELLERAPASERQRDLPTERPGRNEPADAEERAEQRRQAFRSWVRLGFAGMPDEQRGLMAAMRAPAEERALGVGSAPAGGYLVPDEYRREIERAMSAFGGMREVATVFQTSNGADLLIPTTNDTSNTGELVGEQQAVTEQDVSVGQKVFRAYMYSSKEVKVSLELLQDSAFDVEGMLRNMFAERIGRITNTHFTTGSGADRPVGIVNDSVLGVTAAAVGAVTADELINQIYTVDRAYRANARWMCASNTLRDLRKLKDGDGRYIWQPGMSVGNPDTLFGYAYTINDDMPAMATGNRAILFGQLNKYLIRDVMGFRVIRLDERYAENGQVAFFAFMRTDGKLLDAGGNPVKHIVMA